MNETNMILVENTYGKVEIDDNEHSAIRHIQAIANSGYSFFAWTGDTLGIDEHASSIDVNFALLDIRHLYANFIANATYVAEVQQSINGTATVESNQSYNWQKTFLANPNIGFRFSHWIEVGSSSYIDSSNKTNNPLWIQMTRQSPNITIKPVFEEDNEYTKIIYNDGSSSYSYANGTIYSSDFKTRSGYLYDPITGDNSIVRVELGTKVNAIGDSCFMNCHALTAIQSVNALVALGANAFENTSLASFDFTKLEITTIPEAAFKKTKLQIVQNFNTLTTSIKDHAFYGCDMLTSVVIPSNMASISNYAFYGCNALMSINLRSISNRLIEIYANTFSPVGNPIGRKFYMHSEHESLMAYESYGPWKSLYYDIDPQVQIQDDLETILVYDVGPKNLINIYGYLDHDKTQCIVNFNNVQQTVITRPEETNQIQMNFRNTSSKDTLQNFNVIIQNTISSLACIQYDKSKCTAISQFGSNLRYLQENAFKSMQLHNVHLPKTLESMGYGVFSENPMTIANISLDSGTKISDNWIVFQNGDCVNVFGKSNAAIFDAESIEIKKLTRNCFANCNYLTTIKLPSTLRYIDAPLANVIELPNLTTLTIQNNPYFKVENGQLMSIKTKQIYIAIKDMQ